MKVNNPPGVSSGAAVWQSVSFPPQTLLCLQSIRGFKPRRAVLHVHHHRRVAHQRGGEAVHRASGVRRTQRHRVQHPGGAQGFCKSQWNSVKSWFLQINVALFKLFGSNRQTLNIWTDEQWIHRMKKLCKDKHFVAFDPDLNQSALTPRPQLLSFCFFQGVKVDFPPSKLKSGSGEHVCFVLDRLAEEALKRRGFTFRRYADVSSPSSAEIGPSVWYRLLWTGFYLDACFLSFINLLASSSSFCFHFKVMFKCWRTGSRGDVCRGLWQDVAVWCWWGNIFDFFLSFRPNYPSENTEEESVIEDDAELTLSKVEEEMIVGFKPF